MQTSVKTSYVFIDVENVSSTVVDDVCNHIKKLVQGSSRNNVVFKAFSDWRKAEAGWPDISLRHGIECIQQFNHVKQSNSTDIAIVIAVMELVASYDKESKLEAFDELWMVSSDCDYIPLIEYVKKRGVKCHGYFTNNYNSKLNIVYNKYYHYPIQKELSNTVAEANAENAEVKPKTFVYKRPEFTSQAFRPFLESIRTVLSDVPMNKGIDTCSIWGLTMSKMKGAERREFRKLIGMTDFGRGGAYSYLNAFMRLYREYFVYAKEGERGNSEVFIYIKRF